MISSPRSARVVAARKLYDRTDRAKARRFLAEGPQAVREVVDGRPDVLDELFVAAVDDRHADLVARAYRAGATVTEVTEQVLATLATTVNPQGMVGVCRFLDVPLTSIVARRPRLVALLAHARDPGNAGTVLRTADAAGADAVLLSAESVDVYNPKCVRASTGSLFHLPVNVGEPALASIAALRAAGLRVLAADGDGSDDLDAQIDSGRLTQPTCWLFGNEAWGLPDELRAAADAVVRIPLYGRAESLNLATAAAVCLYASARAQRSTGS
jgi:TrmH family RNA methyltransferase